MLYMYRNDHFPVISTDNNGDLSRYVEDCASAIVTVLQKGAVGGVYNIGSKTEFTMAEVAQNLAEKYGLKDAAVCVPDPRPYNDKRYLLDDSKIRRLGWSEDFDFDRGLDFTIAWYKEHATDGDTWPVNAFTCGLITREFSSE